MYNAGILGRASKIGSKLYARIPCKHRCRSYYQQLTAWAMQLLRDEWEEADILSVLLPSLTKKEPETCYQSKAPKIGAGIIIHPNGQYYFIASAYKRGQSIAAMPLPIIDGYHTQSAINTGAVGLGWSLHAGGVITRTVRDLPDDKKYLGRCLLHPCIYYGDGVEPMTTVDAEDSIKFVGGDNDCKTVLQVWRLIRTKGPENGRCEIFAIIIVPFFPKSCLLKQT